MAIRAVSTIVTYRAWDTVANAPKTGDVSNHTLRWVKDGTASAPSNAPSEVDATHAAGIYKLTLTSTETDCVLGSLCGVSSTSAIALFGPEIAFDQTGDGYARLGAPAGASVSADLAAVKTDTGTTIPGRLPAALTANGNMKASLVEILTTALTETSGQLAAAFKKFFNIAAPASTMDHGTLVDTVTTYTGNTPQTGDAYARVGSAGAGLTAIGDTRIAHLDADVSSRTKPADTQAAVTTVANLTNAPTVGDLTAAMKTSVTIAATAATPTAAAVTGSVGSVANLPSAKLTAHAAAVLVAVIGAGSTTTSIVLNGSTGIEGGAPSAVDDFYTGCVLVFTSGALAGQRTSISGYVGATKTLTVGALTGTPIAAVTGIIV